MRIGMLWVVGAALLATVGCGGTPEGQSGSSASQAATSGDAAPLTGRYLTTKDKLFGYEVVTIDFDGTRACNAIAVSDEYVVNMFLTSAGVSRDTALTDARATVSMPCAYSQANGTVTLKDKRGFLSVSDRVYHESVDGSGTLSLIVDETSTDAPLSFTPTESVDP